MLLLLNSAGHATLPAGIDFRDVVHDLYPLLGAGGDSDLVFWTTAELYQLLDETAKRLATVAGVFVERDTSLSLADGVRTYALPTRHVSTLHVSRGAVPLRPATAAELEARDSGWLTGKGTPSRWCQDGDGLATIAVYKLPDASSAGNALNLIEHEFPAAISGSNPTLDIPSPIQDYFALRVLGLARGQESDGAMPEVAAHCAERARLYEAILAAYWGTAQ